MDLGNNRYYANERRGKSCRALITFRGILKRIKTATNETPAKKEENCVREELRLLLRGSTSGKWGYVVMTDTVIRTSRSLLDLWAEEEFQSAAAAAEAR